MRMQCLYTYKWSWRGCPRDVMVKVLASGIVVPSSASRRIQTTSTAPFILTWFVKILLAALNTFLQPWPRTSSTWLLCQYVYFVREYLLPMRAYFKVASVSHAQHQSNLIDLENLMLTGFARMLYIGFIRKLIVFESSV